MIVDKDIEFLKDGLAACLNSLCGLIERCTGLVVQDCIRQHQLYITLQDVRQKYELLQANAYLEIIEDPVFVTVKFRINGIPSHWLFYDVVVVGDFRPRYGMLEETITIKTNNMSVIINAANDWEHCVRKDLLKCKP